MKYFLFSISLLFLSVSSYGQGNFCNSLKTVLQASKDHFNSIKGADKGKQDGFFGEEHIYSAKQNIDGAQESVITVGLKTKYRSIIAKSDTQSAALAEHYNLLAQQLRECLGDAYKITESTEGARQAKTLKAQPVKDGKGNMYEPVLQMVLENTEKEGYILRLEVEEPFFREK